MGLWRGCVLSVGFRFAVRAALGRAPARPILEAMPRPKNGPRPTCRAHPTSVVWRDGSYGVEGHLRPRYKCVPRNGAPPHRFTPALPEQGADPRLLW
jgi:hypothetical protein